MAQNICNSETYRLSERGTIMIEAFPENLPPTIEVEGYTLHRKIEFHISLVATSEIARKNAVADPDFREKVVADFCAYASEHPVEFVRYDGEFRFMSEGDVRTAVVMVEVSNLADFFALLNKKYHLDLEYPPTHITLYTLQPNVGIFMTTSEDKEKLTKVIPPPVEL